MLDGVFACAHAAGVIVECFAGHIRAHDIIIGAACSIGMIKAGWAHACLQGATRDCTPHSTRSPSIVHLLLLLRTPTCTHIHTHTWGPVLSSCMCWAPALCNSGGYKQYCLGFFLYTFALLCHSPAHSDQSSVLCGTPLLAVLPAFKCVCMLSHTCGHPAHTPTPRAHAHQHSYIGAVCYTAAGALMPPPTRTAACSPPTREALQ